MKITKYFTKYSRLYTINLRDEQLGEITISSHHANFTVSLPTKPLGEIAISQFEMPTINWAACGNQVISKTEVFARALNIACSLAVIINSTMTQTERIKLLKSAFNVKDDEIDFDS